MTDKKSHTVYGRQTVYAVLLAISFAHLLNDMMQSVIPAVYPLLKEKFGFTFAQIGVITLVFQLTSSLLQPFAGWIADRHPRPYSLAIGMGFTLVGLLALAAAPSFGWILAAVGLIGCGSSVFHPESSRVAQLASGGRKGLAQSIFRWEAMPEVLWDRCSPRWSSFRSDREPSAGLRWLLSWASSFLPVSEGGTNGSCTPQPETAQE